MRFATVALLVVFSIALFPSTASHRGQAFAQQQQTQTGAGAEPAAPASSPQPGMMPGPGMMRGRGPMGGPGMMWGGPGAMPCCPCMPGMGMGMMGPEMMGGDVKTRGQM